jgi:hypothetical protein
MTPTPPDNRTGPTENSYGEPPVRRHAMGFVSCGACASITDCARRNTCIGQERRPPGPTAIGLLRMGEKRRRLESLFGFPVRTDPSVPPGEIRVERAADRPVPDRRLRTSPHGDALSTRVRTRYPCFFSRWIQVTDVGGRLTPGALKLAAARIRAAAGSVDVAQAMADQIDFEWEERRWEEPPGDAEAAENGMGC